MNKFKLVNPVLFIALFSFASCEKQNDSECDIAMKFQEHKGFEDCAFLLTLNLEDEWRILYPSNLADFNITPSNGLEVCGSFITRTDLSPPCSNFEYVELTSLSQK